MADAAAAVRIGKARVRKTARALQRAERATLNATRAAVRTQVHHVVATVAAGAWDDDADRQKSAAQRQIRAAMAAMVLFLAAAIRDARAKAREAGRALTVGHAAEDGVSIGSATVGAEEDELAAQAAASAYVAAWGSAAIVAVQRWSRGREKSLASALTRTIAQTDGRVRRIAATETASAFNGEIVAASFEAVDEHVEALSEGQPTKPGLAKTSGDPYRTMTTPPAERFVKVWDAMLDLKICAECGKMHGTVVSAGAEFPGGDPPRHCWCRCLPCLLMWTGTIAELEAAWIAGDRDLEQAA